MMDVRRRSEWAVGCAVLGLLLSPQPGHAHPAPAEPPAFHEDDCIVVVDKREQDRWHLEYDVPVEDTEQEPDLLILPDTKTHQFMAVAGQVFARAMQHEVLLSDDPGSTARVLPRWISDADVTRAAKAENAASLGFTTKQVPDTDVLEHHPDLAAAVWSFADDPARVPITSEQGMRGVDWPLSDVPPGGYQIVTYIFSPPYNGWAVRPGLVKVVDGERNPPVITLDDVEAHVFGGQGRRITGCVDAPDGSTLHVAVRQRDAPMDAFEPRLKDVPITGGHFDVCLPNSGVDASLQVRVEVHTPMGASAVARSAAAVTMFSNEAACQPDEVMCCEGANAADVDSTASSANDAGLAGSGPAVGLLDDASAPRGADAPASGGAQGVDPERHATDGGYAPPSGSSCALAGASHFSATWSWLWALAWLATRRSGSSRSIAAAGRDPA